MQSRFVAGHRPHRLYEAATLPGKAGWRGSDPLLMRGFYIAALSRLQVKSYTFFPGPDFSRPLYSIAFLAFGALVRLVGETGGDVRGFLIIVAVAAGVITGAWFVMPFNDADNWRDMKRVETISSDDCVLMAHAVIDVEHLKNDGTLVKNDHGSFNCGFTDYGLRHVVYPEKPGGYVCYKPSGLMELATSAVEYDKCVRNVYVTRPSYSLFHTRYKIRVGWALAGEECTFNRLSGKWRKERCVSTGYY